MAAWLPFAIQGAEALAVFVAAYAGAIPGIPSGDWHAALSIALAKLIPPTVTTSVMNAVRR